MFLKRDPLHSIVASLGLIALAAHPEFAFGQSGSPSQPASKPATAVVEADGTVHVPAFDLPLSAYMSTEARKSLVQQLHADQSAFNTSDIAKLREATKTSLTPLIKHVQERYAVNMKPQMLAGVPVLSVSPKNGITARNRARILINLHAGGFIVGDAASFGLLESIPIAALGRIQVITVDYRLGPEHHFPAASEDVATVYKELLRQYKPENIGIYGCSAGGLLTAEAAAWIQNEKLPRPGAAGIFCAAADANWLGDTYFTAIAFTGKRPPSPNAPPYLIEKPYYGDTDLKNPLLSPVVSPGILAKFPPTLILTATRAAELSAAVYTHAELIKAGTEAELHVWDGLWHGFLLDPDLPESQEAYAVIIKFFDRHLGRTTVTTE
jgi:acetyl esterase/lipase